MQTEQQILIAICIVYAAAAVTALVLRRFKFLWSLIESAAVAPVTLLSLVGAVIGPEILAPAQFRLGTFLMIYGGLVGVVSLWLSFVLKPQLYAKFAGLGVAISIGLVIGCAVAISDIVSLLSNGVAKSLGNPMLLVLTLPVAVAVRRCYTIWQATLSGNKAARYAPPKYKKLIDGSGLRE